MNPIQFFLQWICKVSNPILGIGFGTIFIKSVCLPIYIIRYENSCVKKMVKKYTRSIQQRTERKKSKREMYRYLNVKKLSYSCFIYGIEFTVILLFLRAINTLNNSQTLWFKINEVDRTSVLSYIYLGILVLVEAINFQKGSKIEEVMQIIISGIMVVLLFQTSKTVVAGIVIYWCIANLYNLLIRKIILQGKVERWVEKEYSPVYLESVYNLIKKEGELDGKCGKK